eukprot:TRINITY_DN54478_c0_g1_i1.p1 TRINITY_DN54478_c0_g1~~TRINITY_DN54478_c0_g1_i1.p1  ORF type:complete len:577 (-),score=38.73 TRINITY_DN54478_c0_g1_i1:398-2128(-)
MPHPSSPQAPVDPGSWISEGASCGEIPSDDDESSVVGSPDAVSTDSDNVSVCEVTVHNTGSMHFIPQTESTRTRRLPSRVEGHILQGVAVTEVLSGFGKHMQSNSGESAMQRRMSEKVAELDDFISHDWGTPRLQKVLSLCFLFNHRAAVVASCAIAPPLAVIGESIDVPVIQGQWAKLVCPVIYVTVFLSWQRISSLWRKPKSVFFDKLCINQDDPDEKSAGIMGLAGFLRVSQRLVVLWSPRYFSRLWCTYELVAWSYLHGLDPRKIRFLPVGWCAIHCAFVFGFTLYPILTLIIRQLWPAAEVFVSTVASAMLLPVVCKISCLAQEMNLAEDLIQRFTIHKSECFCCTQKHIHPETGVSLSCDRELVYATLSNWDVMIRSSRLSDCCDGFPNIESGDKALEDNIEKALERFDKTVREDMSRVFSGSKNSALLCLSYKDCVFACVPLVWSGTDYTISLCLAGRYVYAARWVVEYASVPLGVLPVSVAAMVAAVRIMKRVGTYVRPRCLQRIVTVGVSTFVFFFTFTLLWLPGQMLLIEDEVISAGDLFQFTRYILLAFVTSIIMLQPHRILLRE